MTPELPRQIPIGSAFASIGWPNLACSMLYNGLRCNNSSDAAIIIPTAMGYEVIVICQYCFDVLPSDWKREFDAVIKGEKFNE